MKRIEHWKGTTRVAIVSSNYLLHLGLQRIVENEKWVKLVGHLSSFMEVQDLIEREQPHIMIIDTDLTKDAMDQIKHIKSAVPRIRLIMLCGLEDPEVSRLAIDFAVEGIVLKVQPSSVLIATIRHLAPDATNYEKLTMEKESGLLTMNEFLGVSIAHTSCTSQAKWPDGLTEREREVIRLISQGLSNKDIADRLCISSITVRHHLTNIFDKLGVSNRQKLLIRAHQYGIEELTALA